MAMENDEKVLEYIYYWNRPISPGILKEKLSIKHSTLNSTLKRLQQQKLLEWHKYSFVELTNEGREKAEHLSNHHFIIERFLSEVLNMTESQAHEEALNLSPYASCRLIEAISRKLGISHDEIQKQFCLERDYK